jgi:pimeloyl-ACP methyl ester carboxylesterase
VTAVEPAAAKRRVRISAGELAFLDVGESDAPAVVFVHGFPTSSYLWRAFVPMLPPAMRAIAPDLLGAGDSDKPPESVLGADVQARYVGELLDELGLERVAAVAHGHGGVTAQVLALEGRVEVLVLLDAVAADVPPAEAMADLLRLAGRRGANAERVIVRVIEAGTAHSERVPSEAIAEYARPFAGADGSASLARWASALQSSGDVARAGALATLDIPVFLLWGEDDPFVPADVAERMNELIPRSSLALLPGCRHFVPEEAPQTVAPLLYEYLRSAYARMPHVHETGPTTVELGRKYRRPEANGG